jgi:hypothetical protein
MDATFELVDVRQAPLQKIRRRPLTPDPTRAVHQHLLPLELGEVVVHPLRKLSRATHQRVEDWDTRWSELANDRLVVVAHVNHDGVRVAHRLVVVGGLEVLAPGSDVSGAVAGVESIPGVRVYVKVL